MSTISIRLAQSLHDRVRQLADQEHVSINSFIASAVAEKIAALDTETYLKQRAEKGRRTAYERVLKKAPVQPPRDDDRLDT